MSNAAHISTPFLAPQSHFKGVPVHYFAQGVIASVWLLPVNVRAAAFFISNKRIIAGQAFNLIKSKIKNLSLTINN